MFFHYILFDFDRNFKQIDEEQIDFFKIIIFIFLIYLFLNLFIFVFYSFMK
jgi:hypothetical protein